MAERNRMPPWHERLRLRNGREVQIRPIRPEDAEPLRAGFGLLRPEEIRQRFLQPLRELPPELARRLTHPNPRNEFALVAAEPLPPGEALIGAVARVSVAQDTREGEFAILVSHFVAGMGLGRHLMRRLVRWSRGRRVERLHGDVLLDNTAMLALAESLGFRRQRSDSPGLARIALELR
ncbi:MAG: GNAT family N-acetyltransferase [Proteobacteria bacterium]|nr:GNAT family N-acetyltransferase [Pseudomonadota bacterium]